MRVALEHERAAIFIGDAGDLDLPEHSVDAIVCDPPAGIEFMGKKWDSDRGGMIAWSKWLRDTLRPSIHALKPGGHGFVWALPRVAHWTAAALELLDVEIRDVFSHMFGSGMPKGLTEGSGLPSGGRTLVKPQREDWILFRKPLDTKTVAANYSRWGTGCLWVDGYPLEDDRVPGNVVLSHDEECESDGCVEHCAVLIFDDHAGPKRTGGRAAGTVRRAGNVYNAPDALPSPPIRKSSGAASRYFYVAKPARGERDLGLEDLEPLTGGEATGRDDAHVGPGNPRAGAGRKGGSRNTHPTVKSVALMRWLTRLVARPGQVVLDSFAGSGSTIVAALEEGCEVLGCELAEDPRYERILLGRTMAALARTSARV